jgi:hypothetical protein
LGRRAKDANDNPVGRANNNPILDSMLYVIEFPDGESLEYAVNIIAESIYSQVDDEGRQQMRLNKIVDHQTDEDAVTINDGYVIHNGRSSQSEQRKDGSYVYNGRTGPQVGSDLLTYRNPTQFRLQSMQLEGTLSCNQRLRGGSPTPSRSGIGL